MFRVLIGCTLLVVGLFVMCAALAGTHGNPPDDPMKADTWLFYALFAVPLGLGIALLTRPLWHRPIRDRSRP